MSSRRVRKGPGRRPKSLARKRFMELLAEGWSMAATAREVGISRASAHVWKNGTAVKRKDGTVVVVPPLEPPAVRVISPRFLSEDERVMIADLASLGLGPTDIATRLGRAPSTISRELRRNLHTSGQYRRFHAHATAASRRRRTRPLRLATDSALRSYVIGKLKLRWSPQQISRALRRDFPHDPTRWVATETIYQAIYRPATGIVRKPDPSPLRTGRDHRRGHSRQLRAGRRFAQPMLSVHERGFDPADKSEPGHWEGDLIVGPHNRSAIGTLVERQTRYVKLIHLPGFTSAHLHAALVRRLTGLPPVMRRTLTWDQGAEMARHLEITADTGTQIYFCDAASTWQRGSNENTNGLLRQYFPKSTDLSAYSPQHLARVEHELNTRSRMNLNDETPEALFTALLTFERNPGLR